MGSLCLRRWRQAARAGCTRAMAAANAESALIVVFAAIIWREDYHRGRNAVTHPCRSNTEEIVRGLRANLAVPVQPAQARRGFLGRFERGGKEKTNTANTANGAFGVLGRA